MNFLSLKMLVICSVVALLQLALAALPTQFCATIASGESAGAKGWVALQIEEGVAQYSFYLDLTEYYTEVLCPDISLGIKYHIHTEWNNDTSLSAANSYCGSSNAGGHYDPNFACSNYSSAINSDCKDLYRTYQDGYRYACNTTNYNNGHYSLCEVGDTSSKAGVLKLNDGIVQLTSFIDYQPPYAVNYGQADKDSTQWLSFVFHCAQNSARLVCAKFSTTELTPCGSAFSSFASTSTDDDHVTQTRFNSAIIISTILCTVGGFVLGGLIVYFFFRKSSEENHLNKV